MTQETETRKGRTTSAEFNRLLPVILPLLLWALCRQLLDSSDQAGTYVEGLLDGAFTILLVRAVVIVARSYAEAGGRQLADAHKGVMLGMVAALAGVLVISALALLR